MKLKMEAMQRTQIANHNTTMSTVLQMQNTMQTITGLQHVHSEQITHNTKSVNSRFDVAYNKQKYHEELLKNQQWKYSAPRLSTGYWNGLGENEGAVAWEFLKQIKQRTEEMRYGTGDGDIFINLTNNHLPYNEAFLPHWKEFANALEQYQRCLKCQSEDDTDTKFCLMGVELPNRVLELLSKALKSTRFNRFVLGNNSIGQAGIDFALKYLKSNRIMKQFALVDNTIDNMKDVKQLCQIVKDHPSLERLTLNRCRGGEGIDGYEMLQMIMDAGKRLRVVNLPRNNISTRGDTFISDFLAGNPILNTLNLSHNQLDDNDAMAIAGALKHNKNLRVLRLMDNNLTRTGWAALRKAQFDDTSLNSAADSNHTCAIKYPTIVQGLDTSEMNGDADSG